MVHHAPGFLRLCEAARARVLGCDVASLRADLASEAPPVIIDVREDHEWAEGHVPGAVHLGRGILERDVEARFPDRDADLVLMCGGGYRSALAAASLQDMGYTRVRTLDGGRRAWLAAGLPWTSGG